MHRIRYTPLSTFRIADFLAPADDTSTRQFAGGGGLHWLAHQVTGWHLVPIRDSNATHRVSPWPPPSGPFVRSEFSFAVLRHAAYG